MPDEFTQTPSTPEPDQNTQPTPAPISPDQPLTQPTPDMQPALNEPVFTPMQPGNNNLKKILGL